MSDRQNVGTTTPITMDPIGLDRFCCAQAKRKRNTIAMTQLNVNSVNINPLIFELQKWSVDRARMDRQPDNIYTPTTATQLDVLRMDKWKMYKAQMRLLNEQESQRLMTDTLQDIVKRHYIEAIGLATAIPDLKVNPNFIPDSMTKSAEHLYYRQMLDAMEQKLMEKRINTGTAPKPIVINDPFSNCHKATSFDQPQKQVRFNLPPPPQATVKPPKRYQPYNSISTQRKEKWISRMTEKEKKIPQHNDIPKDSLANYFQMIKLLSPNVPVVKPLIANKVQSNGNKVDTTAANYYYTSPSPMQQSTGLLRLPTYHS